MSSLPSSPLWRGDLVFDLQPYQYRLHAVAVAVEFPNTPALRDSATWPSQINCNHAHLHLYNSVTECINSLGALGAALFKPADPDGFGIKQAIFEAVGRTLWRRRVVFEIPCRDGGATFCIFSMNAREDTFVLYGVLRVKEDERHESINPVIEQRFIENLRSIGNCDEGNCSDKSLQRRLMEDDNMTANDIANAVNPFQWEGNARGVFDGVAEKCLVEDRRLVWQGVIHIKVTDFELYLNCVAVQDDEGALVDASG